VGQPRRTGEVADRLDAALAGPKPFVNNDVISVDGDTGVFEPDFF
jgi:hypothetical protein